MQIIKMHSTNVKIHSTVFFPDNRAVYGVLWKKVIEPDRPHMTI